MTLKRIHMAWLTCLTLLLSGCVREAVPSFEEPGITLTVRCDNPLLATKADGEKDGEQGFNENLIKSVDFLFYPGENPGENTDAVHYIRKELSADPMQAGLWEATFNLVIKKDVIGLLFTEANDLKATVYALVNFERGFVGDLSGTSRAELNARRIETDFAATESGYIQPYFLMDGSTVITYDADATPNSTGEIGLKRFASKLTVALSVASRVELKHQAPVDPNQDPLPDEVWTPVPHTMRVYLVDGVKSTLIGGTDPDLEHFSYSAEAHQRAYVRDTGTPYLNTETVGEITYYHSWPMYSYPVSWTADVLPDYPNMDYTSGLPAEPPYFKLEMDWRREAEHGYSYDRRKYYYKIFLPTDKLERNNWYGLYLDVSILGSETDEGKAVLEPTCYLLDWQNKSFAINKYATISKARYLSVDKTVWEINNMESLSIPFLSSHNVTVVPGSVKARRPYYGAVDGTRKVDAYYENLHAWIRKEENTDNYYLDFNNQPEGEEAYEPSGWLTNTSISIELNHPLQNDYIISDFDYSPYTIEFDIVHTDLADDHTTHTYAQYLRHITIIQYPGIYINRLTNRDTEVIRIRPSGNNYYCGYPDGEAPWLDKPWGYVFVNGGRFIRRDDKTNSSSADPYYNGLSGDKAKKEYQWQAVWYTGGSRDIFDIHVTVLPSTSDFVIGDPREDKVNNLDDPILYPNTYKYVDTNLNNVIILEGIRSDTEEYHQTGDSQWTRTGFNEADALYGDEPYRALKWYYPTEKSTRTENMMAPSYRISTKFGGTEFGSITKEYAEYRCAGYQEDGFPAGRWRLPTKAEVHFMAQLSANSTFVEPLFGNTVYWSAHGAIAVSTGNVSNSDSKTALLRCVYDSWYWDKVDGLDPKDPRRPDPTQFVWGDKER